MAAFPRQLTARATVLIPKRHLDVHRQFQELKAESERLRWEFVRCELEISYTIATFVEASRGSDVFRESCIRTARKGYDTAVKLASPGVPAESQREFEAKLGHLRAVLANPKIIDREPPAVATVPTRVNGFETGPRHEPLTSRETEVLKCIAEGHSTKVLAQMLGITFKTAACHRQRVMDKLGIHETAGLVRYAIRQGMIRP